MIVRFGSVVASEDWEPSRRRHRGVVRSRIPVQSQSNDITSKIIIMIPRMVRRRRLAHTLVFYSSTRLLFYSRPPVVLIADVCQFHTWLATSSPNSQPRDRLVVFSGMSSAFNFAVMTVVFFWISRRVSTRTGELVGGGWIFFERARAQA